MPRLKNAVPKYRKHKASGQAVVTLSGHDRYLGKHGTKPSRELYERLIGEWLAGGRQSPTPAPDALSVTELVHRYWQHAKAFYRRSDGHPTATADSMKPVLRAVRELYGDVPADEFGPIALKTVRQRFVESSLTRRTVNDYIDRIKRMYPWGVSEELVEVSTLRRLETVEGLRKGKTQAHDNPPIPPVSDIVVDATLKHLSPTVAHMVQIQRLTGARPGEVCIMRPTDIEPMGDVWVYIPERHKTEHHGKRRAIVIGPRAQAILTPYLTRDLLDYCFKPAEVRADHLMRLRATRKTPLSCGNRPGKRQGKKLKKRELAIGAFYTKDSYRQAIHRACDRAFLPTEAPIAKLPGESDAARLRRLTDSEREDLKRWQSDHRWNPNQLRHTMGTKTREQFGIEAVAAALGHSKTDTSEIYAERNLQLAAEVAKQLG